MTSFHLGPSAIDLLIADTWNSAYLRDSATTSLLAEPPATPNESRCRARSSLHSARKSSTIGDNQEEPLYDPRRS